MVQSLCDNRFVLGAQCSVLGVGDDLRDARGPSGSLRAQVALGRTTLTASLLTWELQPSSICMKTMQLWLKTTGAVRFVARQAGQSNDLVRALEEMSGSSVVRPLWNGSAFAMPTWLTEGGGGQIRRPEGIRLHKLWIVAVIRGRIATGRQHGRRWLCGPDRLGLDPMILCIPHSTTAHWQYWGGFHLSIGR